MNDYISPSPSQSEAFYDLLKRDLTAAMKARQAEAVSALRSVIAAIDNARAVEGKSAATTEIGQHVVAGGAGVGSTEAQRRQLSPSDVQNILEAEITDRSLQAQQYEVHGEVEAANRLRHEADVLRAYLHG